MSVIDASVWLELVVDRFWSDVLPEAPILVPSHFDAEVLSGLRRLTRRGELSQEAAARWVERLPRASMLRVPAQELIEDAWSLSAAVSAYDALYVALARREGVGLLTADAKLAAGATDLCEIHLLA